MRLADKRGWRVFCTPLLMQMVRREIEQRYRGSVMGLAWAVLNPLLMLAVYTFVFGEIFQARWHGGGSHADFALNLFAGLTVFSLFAECVNRAPGLVLDNVNYVKKVVFPLEILAVISLLSTLFHVGISLLILFLFYTFMHGLPHWEVILMPLIWLPLMLFVLGVSWLLASLGVFVRDIGQVVGVLTTALLFLSPVFFPTSAIPVAVRDWLFLNPLAPVIEQTRAVLFSGSMPDGVVWCSELAGGMLVAWLGYRWFVVTRRGFADVL